MSAKIYDFIAIGLGPFNLSLAALTSNIEELSGLILEQKTEFNWHPGMMLESAHLQTPFMSDLVTLADPTHPLSFLNYKKQQGQLYSFYIREDFFLMRKEYNQYCRWAIEQIDAIRFQHCVKQITFEQELNAYHVVGEKTSTDGTSAIFEFHTKALVLGTGPSPWIPDCCEEHQENLTHTADYLFKKEEIQKQKSITIVGGGQSAAEIYYDLLQEIDAKQYQLNWVTRSPRFFPLEYSKLTLEMTSPEYVDYFYSLPASKRDELNREQKNLYKGINQSLINEIFDLLYVKQLSGAVPTRILSNSQLTQCTKKNNNLQLTFKHHEQDTSYTLDSEAVVLATGYSYKLPDFLSNITDRIQWDDKGRFAVKRNYTIDQHSSIFVQNAELHTHGFVTPDLGMACYRNSCIIRDLLGKEYHPIEKRIAFQQFGAPEDLQANTPSTSFAASVDVEHEAK